MNSRIVLCFQSCTIYILLSWSSVWAWPARGLVVEGGHHCGATVVGPAGVGVVESVALSTQTLLAGQAVSRDPEDLTDVAVLCGEKRTAPALEEPPAETAVVQSKENIILNKSGPRTTQQYFYTVVWFTIEHLSAICAWADGDHIRRRVAWLSLSLTPTHHLVGRSTVQVLPSVCLVFPSHLEQICFWNLDPAGH